MSTRPSVFPSKVAIPTQTYVCRVESYKCQPTKDGYPMSIVRCAIASPESFEFEGNVVPCGGRNFQFNLLWKEGEQWGSEAAWQVLDKLNYTETEFEADPAKSTDSQFFNNLYFKAILKAEKSFHTKDGSFSNSKRSDLYQLDSEGNPLLKDYRIVCDGKDIVCACDPSGQQF